MRRALEAGCRRGGESVVAAAELLPVAGRLLEVVAGDLVLLDERGVLVQPERELLVEVGARRLRQPVVGGVADQQVPEPERLVVRQRRPARPDQLLAYEREQSLGNARA